MSYNDKCWHENTKDAPCPSPREFPCWLMASLDCWLFSCVYWLLLSGQGWGWTFQSQSGWEAKAHWASGRGGCGASQDSTSEETYTAENRLFSSAPVTPNVFFTCEWSEQGRTNPRPTGHAGTPGRPRSAVGNLSISETWRNEAILRRIQGGIIPGPCLPLLQHCGWIWWPGWVEVTARSCQGTHLQPEHAALCTPALFPVQASS